MKDSTKQVIIVTCSLLTVAMGAVGAREGAQPEYQGEWCQSFPPRAVVGLGVPYPCDGPVAEAACDYMSGYCGMDLEVMTTDYNEGMCVVWCKGLD